MAKKKVNSKNQKIEGNDLRVEKENKAEKVKKTLVNKKVLSTVLLASIVAYFYMKFSGSESGEQIAFKKPDLLLDYALFREQYPRLRQLTKVEESRRHLLFIQDLITIGTHNIGYLRGKQTYSLRQTPFKSDRTLLEQRDILGQLEEFNLTQIKINFEQQTTSTSTPNTNDIDDDDDDVDQKTIDSPVSFGGFGGSSSRSSSSNDSGSKGKRSVLKTGNKMSKWLTRTLQGDAHFEIPNYPLDSQPNPESITHIDSDLRYCSGQIHDQGHCGACYAFSWLSYVEWHYCRQTNGKQQQQQQQQQTDENFPAFSAQHLVDCGHLTKLSGCREGFLTDAKEFTQKYGLHLEQDYPYKGKQSKQCSKLDGSIRVKVVDFKRIQVVREEWEKVLLEQPILLQVHLPTDVMSYHQGIHPGSNCNKQMAHGMVLVGYGREEGIPYWILKNSMGFGWGENGYLRLSREAPMKECFRTGFIAKFKFESLDQDAYYDLYDNLNFEPSEHIVEKPVLTKGIMNWFDGGESVIKTKLLKS